MATQTAPTARSTVTKKYKVTITAYFDPGDPPTPGNVKFDMNSDLKTGWRKLEFDKTKDKMKKDESYELAFTLVDNTGLGLTFAPALQDALWASAGDAKGDPPCPTSACSNPQFSATARSTDGKTLTVINLDDNVENIAFTLRFLPAGANPSSPNSYVEYDPISSNKDGGT